MCVREEGSAAQAASVWPSALFLSVCLVDAAAARTLLTDGQTSAFITNSAHRYSYRLPTSPPPALVPLVVESSRSRVCFGRSLPSHWVREWVGEAATAALVAGEGRGSGVAHNRIVQQNKAGITQLEPGSGIRRADQTAAAAAASHRDPFPFLSLDCCLGPRRMNGEQLCAQRLQQKQTRLSPHSLSLSGITRCRDRTGKRKGNTNKKIASKCKQHVSCASHFLAHVNDCNANDGSPREILLSLHLSARLSLLLRSRAHTQHRHQDIHNSPRKLSHDWVNNGRWRPSLGSVLLRFSARLTLRTTYAQ